MRAMQVLCLVLALWGSVSTARAELRVFELHHAVPESLLPVVEPLLGPYENVSVFRNSLVVNAGSGTLARLERLLAELDVPPRSLRISVRRQDSANQTGSGAAVSGTLQRGHVSLSTGAARSGSGVELSTVRRSSTRHGDGEQSLRALEGSTVMIQDGVLVPLASGSVFGPGIAWEELNRGFGVRARVSGEEVTLELETRDERIDAGTIRTGGIVTSVRGRLGEWIALGGTQHSSSTAAAGLGSTYATRDSSTQQYEVRVELLP